MAAAWAAARTAPGGSFESVQNWFEPIQNWFEPVQRLQVLANDEGNLLPTECHTQNNKDQGRRPVTRRRERDSEREGRKRREGGRG